MHMTIDDLVAQAKHLAPEEQAVLSERILELVSPHDPQWIAEWAAEGEDRLAAYRRGEMEAYDFDEVMESLRIKHGIK